MTDHQEPLEFSLIQPFKVIPVRYENFGQTDIQVQLLAHLEDKHDRDIQPSSGRQIFESSSAQTSRVDVKIPTTLDYHLVIRALPSRDALKPCLYLINDENDLVYLDFNSFDFRELERPITWCSDISGRRLVVPRRVAFDYQKLCFHPRERSVVPLIRRLVAADTEAIFLVLPAEIPKDGVQDREQHVKDIRFFFGRNQMERGLVFEGDGTLFFELHPFCEPVALNKIAPLSMFWAEEVAAGAGKMGLPPGRVNFLLPVERSLVVV